MKQFFEQYGGVALGILALLVLIAMITPVGNIIKTSLQGTTSKFAGGMNEQLDDAMAATAKAQESATQTSSVKMNNINKNGVVGDFSSKGNLVTINDKQFRVLEVKGTQVKVVMMENYSGSLLSFNTSSIVTTFDDIQGQKYLNSTLDNKMTEYYNSLPVTIQNAIVEQNINQTLYADNGGTSINSDFSSWWSTSFTNSTSSGTNYYLLKKAEINIGNKKVYALDVDEVIAYLGSNSTAKDVNEMFFNVRNNCSKSVWLRSASTFDTYYAFSIIGSIGSIGNSNARGGNEVRPAFVIDLSLL